MKLLKLLISIFALFISGSVVAQSVEIVSPDEGDSVSMDGFMIQKLRGQSQVPELT